MKTHKDLIRILVIWIFIFIALPLFSQTTIKGKVVDADSDKALPYVSIYFVDNNLGTVSNADGCFRFIMNETESNELIFSCIGYETLKYNITNGIPAKVQMTRAVYSLKPLEVMDEKPEHNPIQIFYAAVNDAMKNKQKRSARSYLSLETIGSNDVPIEVLEAFYQSDYSIKHGLSGMTLKNGRFGMMDQDGQFFSSLQTTQVLTNYELFLQARKSYYPHSPFSLSKAQGDKKFIFTMDRIIHDRDNLIAVIKFIPKDGEGELFGGEAYIGLGDLKFRQIKMRIDDTEQVPFAPISPEAKLDKVNLNLVLNFRQDVKGKIIYDYILFNYDFDYVKPQQSQTMTTEALLVFYDYEHPFLMPLCDASALSTDYEKIMATPFHTYFWDQNYVFAQTTAMKDHTDYFVDNGVVINYEDLCVGAKPVNNPIKVWNANDPINWDDFLIKDIKDLGVDTPTFTWNYRNINEAEAVNLDFNIFLDCNIDGDSLYFCCRSIFNKKSSYYFDNKDSMALEYINLQFNLVESVRRKMAEALCNKRYKLENAQDINLIYQDYMGRLDKMMFAMMKEVQGGDNTDKLAEWKNKVSEDLIKATASLSP